MNDCERVMITQITVFNAFSEGDRRFHFLGFFCFGQSMTD